MDQEEEAGDPGVCGFFFEQRLNRVLQFGFLECGVVLGPRQCPFFPPTFPADSIRIRVNSKGLAVYRDPVESSSQTSYAGVLRTFLCTFLLTGRLSQGELLIFSRLSVFRLPICACAWDALKRN
jgi:hypothetical protein